MTDSSVTIHGLPVPVVAAIVTGLLGFLGAILAAKINKRKTGPEPMPTVTVDYAYPRNSPHPSVRGLRKLRLLSTSLIVVAALFFLWSVYGQAPASPDDRNKGTKTNEARLAPMKAEAITVQDSVILECSKQRVTYTAGNLIDQNPNTAWWASTDDDGEGRFAVITFNSIVHLTKVGLIPGYTNQAPRKDRDCKLSDAFGFNRFVSSVRYDFDDGSHVVQEFRPEPRMQTQPVDTTTKTVRITILSTELPGNADNDTLISETYFAGSVGG